MQEMLCNYFAGDILACGWQKKKLFLTDNGLCLSENMHDGAHT